jgi:putative MATE family efflux protein
MALKDFFKRYIGDKAFYREMFFVAFPIALQQLISASVNIVDSAMIGRWGNLAFGPGGSEVSSAAVMIAGRYMTTFENIMILLAISCTIFIAQYFGARNKEAMRKVFGLCMKLTIGFGLGALILGFFFRQEIVLFFSTGVGSGMEMLTLGRSYLAIVAWTFIPYSLSVALSFCLRAIKKTKIPLLSSGAAAIFNLVMNYILIYPLGMGVIGAAIATLLARFVELGILVYYYFRHKPEFYGPFAEVFEIPRAFAVNILRKGWPMVIAQALTEGLAMFMFFAYSRVELGNATNIAAINLSTRVVELIFAFVGGMGTAAAIMVGSRLGAGKIEEAKRNARWQISYILMMSMATVLIMIGLIPIIQILFSYDVAGNQLLAVAMVLQALALPFLFYSSNVIFITRAGGYTKAPIFITNIPYILIKAPLVSLFVFVYPGVIENSPWLQTTFAALGLPVNLVIFVFIIDRFIEVVRAIIAYIVYHRADWQKDITRQTSRSLKKKPEIATT